MKKRNGFTLIELIGIIIILGVLVVIGVPSLIRTLNNDKNKEYEVFEKNLFLATEAYISKNQVAFPLLENKGGIAVVDIGTLVDAGLIKSNVINPKTGGKINIDDFVKVTTLFDEKKNHKYYNYEYIKVGKKEVYEFAYKPEAQEFISNKAGNYKLEVWGAQGGSVSDGTETYTGGYGAYASGIIRLSANEKIFIYTGGSGTSDAEFPFKNEEAIFRGGYNGGGYGYTLVDINDHTKLLSLASSGGGATHISYGPSLDDIREMNPDEETLELLKNDIIILASGGGGAFKDLTRIASYYMSSDGGHGGGYKGSYPLEENVICYNGPNAYIYPGRLDDYFGTHSNNKMNSYCLNSNDNFDNEKILLYESANFGYGGYQYNDLESEEKICDQCGTLRDLISGNYTSVIGISGGGSGFYGGGFGFHIGGNGGFSYVGSPYLENKNIFCYKCEENHNELTFATTKASSEPVSESAKKGNGYARITYLGF